MIDALVALVVFLVGLVLAYFSGKAKQRDSDEIDRQKDKAETEERIKDAIGNVGNDWRDLVRRRK